MKKIIYKNNDTEIKRMVDNVLFCWEMYDKNSDKKIKAKWKKMIKCYAFILYRDIMKKTLLSYKNGK